MKRNYYNCKSCNERDSFDDMVCCDCCDEWHHYICAGVRREIKNLHWICQECTQKYKETYQQAKAAEDSICRNLETKKKTSAPVQRVLVQDAENFVGPENVDILISSKIEAAIKKFFESNLGSLISETTAKAGAQGKVANRATTATILLDAGGEACAIDSVDGACSIDFFDNVGDTANGINVTGCVCSIDPVDGIFDTDSVDGARAIDSTDAINLDDGARDVVNDISAAESIVMLELPITKKEQVPQFEELLYENFDFYYQIHEKKGGNKKLATTMRIISNTIIDDSVLQHYSFEGRRTKFALNKYTKLIDLIVDCTHSAHNAYNKDRKNFKPVSKEEVKMYFRASFLKGAKQRLD